MRQTAIVLLLVFLGAAASPAADAQSAPRAAAHAVADEVRRYARDAKSLATAPLHWDRKQWGRFGAGVGAVAVVYVADQEIEDLVQRNRSSFSDHFSETITPWGASRAQKLSILMILGGAVGGNDRVRDAGRDALESQLWASNIVTPLLKRGAGRARPIQEQGARSFHAFDSGYDSFPSNHATSSWAFATAVAGHFDGWVVPTIVYTVATGVSLARVNDRVHFPSDVVAGALIGRAVARGIVARHRDGKTAWVITPIVLERGAGLTVRVVRP